MRVLVVGSGGREHALCWALAASPLLTKLWCAPGNPGIAQVAECVPIGAAGHSPPWSPSRRTMRSTWWSPAPRRRWSPASPTRWRRRASPARPIARRGAARGQQGLHQGDVRRGRHPHRAVGAVRRRGRGARVRPPPRRADRGEGRRAGRRQGRGGGRDRGRGEAAIDAMMERARFGEAGAAW